MQAKVLWGFLGEWQKDDGSSEADAADAEKVAGLAADFRRRAVLLFTLLQSNKLQSSQRAPHLRQLLLRLNFNGFIGREALNDVRRMPSVRRDPAAAGAGGIGVGGVLPPAGPGVPGLGSPAGPPGRGGSGGLGGSGGSLGGVSRSLSNASESRVSPRGEPASGSFAKPWSP